MDYEGLVGAGAQRNYAAEDAKAVMLAHQEPKTVRENLDRKINALQNELTKLQASKNEMEKFGMLDLDLHALRRAMQY